MYDHTSGLRLTLKACPIVTIVTIAICYLTQLVAGWFGIDLPEQNNLAIVRQMAGWNLSFALVILQIVLILPAIEEFLFRGLLFRLPARHFCRDRLGPSIVVAAIAAAIFSFGHYPDWVGLFKGGAFTVRSADNAFVALWFFGFAQCGLYRRTGSIKYPILNHMLFNAINLVLLFLIPQS